METVKPDKGKGREISSRGTRIEKWEVQRVHSDERHLLDQKRRRGGTRRGEREDRRNIAERGGALLFCALPGTFKRKKND